jgi:hypothetical protein
LGTGTTDSERTAFLFNFTSGEKQDQKLGVVEGQYQTFNSAAAGPSFGGGFDLLVDGVVGDTWDGIINNWSYGPGFGDNIASFGGATMVAAILHRIDDLEVFSISPAGPTAVTPEPASLALLGLGATGIFGSAMRRRRQRAGLQG